MKELPPVILFDMDGTLACYKEQMVVDLQQLASPGEPMFDLHGDAPKWFENRMDAIKRQPGWWEGLAIHPLGMELWYEAGRIGFHRQILTKGPMKTPNAWTEKLKWCYNKLNHHSVTITSAPEADYHKGLVYGRVFVDDYPEYMEAWLAWRKNGVGIMIADESNAGFKHPNVIRYDGKKC